MAIDYVVEYACEPKRRFGPDGLLERLQWLERLLARRERGPTLAARAQEAGFELRPVAFHCARCPANHAGREFGCFGSVHSPLSGAAEEWLVELLPGPPRKKEHGEIARQRALVEDLRRLLATREIDGRPVDARRRGGRPALNALCPERSRAAERRFGSFWRPERVTSSQLLQLLLFEDALDPATAELLCRVLGAWADGGRGGDGIPEAVFTLPVDEGDDPSVVELKQLLRALMVACSLDVPVRTTMRSPDSSVSQPLVPARGPQTNDPQP